MWVHNSGLKLRHIFLSLLYSPSSQQMFIQSIRLWASVSTWVSVHMLMRSYSSCTIMCSKTTHYLLLRFLNSSLFSFPSSLGCLVCISAVTEMKSVVSNLLHIFTLLDVLHCHWHYSDTCIRVDSPLSHSLKNGICTSCSIFSCRIVACLASQWLLNIIINESPVDCACHIDQWCYSDQSRAHSSMFFFYVYVRVRKCLSGTAAYG